MKRRPDGEPNFNPEEAKAPEQKEKIKETAPEKELKERQLNSEEVKGFKGEMDEYTEGLRLAKAGLEAELEELKAMSAEWESFERTKEIRSEIADLEEQIEGLVDSSEAIEEAGDAAIVKIKG